MSSVRFSLEGLTELRQALQRLPEELKTEAAEIVVDTARQAQQSVAAAYPTGPTGNLKRRVQLSVQGRSSLGIVATVKSASPHSHLFEWGTHGKVRETRKGWKRGVMPAAEEKHPEQAMIPKVIRLRQRMIAKLIELVRSKGFEVNG